MSDIATIKPYLELMRLHRPIGTFLLLWPTLIALWLASDGTPRFKTLLIFVLGVVIMRAAGCVINDFADRNIDPYVPRTKTRPLAKKVITEKEALRLFLLLLAVAFVLALLLKTQAILLSTVAVLLAIIYPFAKRYTNYPQFILGLAFSWSIPMAYAQVQGGMSSETWLLYVSTMLWVVAYDTQYAMVDKRYDLKIGVKSTAIAFGNYDKIIIFCLQLLFLLGLIIIGVDKDLNHSYFVGLLIALGLAIYQQWLIRDSEPENCFAAFLNNNYIGAIIFCGLLFGLK